MKGAAAAARAAGHILESATIAAAAMAGEAAAAALEDDLGDRGDEVEMRLQATAPALSEQVRAGAEARAPQLFGATRAARNVGVHWRPGACVGALAAALVRPQRAQRGGHRRGRGGSGALSSSDAFALSEAASSATEAAPVSLKEPRCEQSEQDVTAAAAESAATTAAEAAAWHGRSFAAAPETAVWHGVLYRRGKPECADVAAEQVAASSGSSDAADVPGDATNDDDVGVFRLQLAFLECKIESATRAEQCDAGVQTANCEPQTEDVQLALKAEHADEVSRWKHVVAGVAEALDQIFVNFSKLEARNRRLEGRVRELKLDTKIQTEDAANEAIPLLAVAAEFGGAAHADAAAEGPQADAAAGLADKSEVMKYEGQIPSICADGAAAFIQPARADVALEGRRIRFAEQYISGAEGGRCPPP